MATSMGAFTMTLCGGQGRSRKLNGLCFWRTIWLCLNLAWTERGPSIVDSSPGEKLSIMGEIVVCPHPS